tara:strand:- start:1315 stop:2220 length:906 start_codon:yes stop_codon:yes gene_type:complete
MLQGKSDVYKYSRKELTQETEATTENISKWLLLASQLENVELNPFRYEEAHLWCEPVGDALDSEASHHSSIITPLTRFLFISNALEETYRFTSSFYEFHYNKALSTGASLNRKRNYSAQAGWLLDEVFFKTPTPKYYQHKVDAYLVQLRWYQNTFGHSFDIELEHNDKRSFGLSLVRNIRNHIAHGLFPIVDNPENGPEWFNAKTKLRIITLLNFSSCIAIMNIQMILYATNSEFKSDSYHYLCNDPDWGEQIETRLKLEYVLNLHIKQEFGLNESSMWAMHRSWLDGENTDTEEEGSFEP